MLTQLGLSLMMPLLLCLGLCYWLHSSAGAGVWVYIPGFFFGLGGSFSTAYKFYRSVTEREKKKEEKKKVSFNRHD